MNMTQPQRARGTVLTAVSLIGLFLAVGYLSLRLAAADSESDSRKATTALPLISPAMQQRVQTLQHSTFSGDQLEHPRHPNAEQVAVSTVTPSAKTNAPACGKPCVGVALEDADALRRRHGMNMPRCCAGDGLSSEWMAHATGSNSSLLDYFYPRSPQQAWKRGSVDQVWRPVSSNCRLAVAACYCFHVTGSPIKAENPDAWRDSISIANNPSGKKRCELCKNFNNCSCLAPDKEPHPGPGCLFGDMRPGKLLAVIGACRRLGITHIIEEGRYGGLSAYMCTRAHRIRDTVASSLTPLEPTPISVRRSVRRGVAMERCVHRTLARHPHLRSHVPTVLPSWADALHGFKVTSVELLPIDFVASSLRNAVPTMRLMTGDGSQLVPQLVRDADPTERVAVIFDGEKRHKAYATYKQVASRVHLAVFDDSFHERFHNFLDAKGETTWHTNLDSKYMTSHGPARDTEQLRPFETMLRHAATNLMRFRPELRKHKKERDRLIDDTGRLNLPPGGLQNMAHYHFVLVRGGAWRDGDELW